MDETPEAQKWQTSLKWKQTNFNPPSKEQADGF